MRRMSDGTFIGEQPDMDDVYAIRIKNGEFYIIGWMESVMSCTMEIVKKPEDSLLDRDCFSDIDSLNTSIATSVTISRSRQLTVQTHIKNFFLM